MNYTRQLPLSLLIPARVVFGAGAVVAAGTLYAGRAVGEYFQQADVFARSTGELYSHGLQMGQAVRNVVLEPGNKKSSENLQAAAKALDEAAAQARASAPTPQVLGTLKRVNALREDVAATRAKLVAVVVGDPDAAKVLLVQTETPQWRKMRDLLIELKQGAAMEKLSIQARAQSHLHKAGMFVLMLAMLCTGLCKVSVGAAEQSRGIGEVNVAVTQLDMMTQQNAALVEQSAAAAEGLKGQSSQLLTAVSKFRV